MTSEREWVETVKLDISKSFSDEGLTVETQKRLPYAYYAMGYSEQQGKSHALQDRFGSPGYSTDMIITEPLGSSAWIPRVVVEFKLGSVTTHDALTYSAKAATHKSVHPYLRYGIVIGKHAGPVPRRLTRHGQQFDFMLTLESEKLSRSDRGRLIQLLMEEVDASRVMSNLMVGKSRISLFHRKLVVAP